MDPDAGERVLLERVHRLAVDLLAPHAQDVDEHGVPPTHLRALAAVGVFGMSAPVEAGGLAVSEPTRRAVQEELAAADCSTWLVQTQHHTPVALVAAAHPVLRERILPRLAAGDLVAGIAVAHLRSYPRRVVEARRVAGGWRFTGRAPWYTGWGLNDVLVLGGVSPDGEVVFALARAQEAEGLHAGPAWQLAAMMGARTVPLDFDGFFCPDADIVSHADIASWLEQDRLTTLDASPAVFGLTRAALQQLTRVPDDTARRAAAALSAELATLRAECYRLRDASPPGTAAPQRLAGRAAAHALCIRATAALVAAGGGRSLARSEPAQRFAREALFLSVQAQSAASRAATLAQLSSPPAHV